METLKVIENVFWGVLLGVIVYHIIMTLKEQKTFHYIWKDKLQYVFEDVSFADKAAVYKSMYAIINGLSIYENIACGEKSVRLYFHNEEKEVLIKTFKCPKGYEYTERPFKIKDYEGIAKWIKESGVFDNSKPFN